MHYAIPQFIEVEDKIIGPLTMRQFLWLLAGGGIIFILYFVLKLPALIIVSIPIGGLAVGLAFVKFYNMPLGGFLLALARFNLTPQIFLWKRKERVFMDDEKRVRTEEVLAAPEAPKPRPVSGRLQRLAWELDMRSETREEI